MSVEASAYLDVLVTALEGVGDLHSRAASVRVSMRRAFALSMELEGRLRSLPADADPGRRMILEHRYQTALGQYEYWLKQFYAYERRGAVALAALTGRTGL